MVEFKNNFRVEFNHNQDKQKLWIELLLRCTQADIHHLADILDLPVDQLIKVHQGTAHLDWGSSENLEQLFLVAFCN